MRKIAVCNHCEADVSKPVELSEKLECISSIHYKTNEEFIEIGKGRFIETKEITYLGALKLEELTEQAIWLNTDDMAYGLVLDPLAPIGCCGPDGGLNVKCICDVRVGSLFKDCLGPHYFSPHPVATRWIDYIDDPQRRARNRMERLYALARRNKSRKRHAK